jgi:uncharacterized protein with von Willebrand factor type A (vWA) domain
MYRIDQRTINATLANVAVRIANKEMNIVWHDTPGVFYTNNSDIYLDKAFKKEIETCQGLVAHEAGHIGYGSFTINANYLANTWKDEGMWCADNQLIHHICNLSEDIRVDEINEQIWPGYARFLREYRDSIIPDITKNMIKDKNLLLYIFLNFKDYKDFKHRPIEIVNISKKDWKDIKRVKKLLLNELTIDASLITIKKIYEIIKKYFPTPPEKEKQRIFKGTCNFNGRAEDNKEAEQIKKNDIITNLLKKLMKAGAGGKAKKSKGKSQKGKGEGEGEGKGEGTEELLDDLLDGTEAEVLKIKESLSDAKNKIDQQIKEAKKQKYISNPNKRFSTLKREILTVKSENASLDWNYEPESYEVIIKRYAIDIKATKAKLARLKNTTGVDKSSKRGRINNKVVSAKIGGWQNKRFYDKKVRDKELRILLMCDISGSMCGKKIDVAKQATIVFAEALKDIAKTRIVTFTGYKDVYNIVIKDWDETLTKDKAERIRLSYGSRWGSNLDGLSIKTEAKNLNPEDYIIIISDGQPAGKDYGISDAVNDLKEVKQKMWAFSINAKGEHLNKMYGKRFNIVKSSNQAELGVKITRVAERILAEFKQR